MLRGIAIIVGLLLVGASFDASACELQHMLGSWACTPDSKPELCPPMSIGHVIERGRDYVWVDSENKRGRISKMDDHRFRVAWFQGAIGYSDFELPHPSCSRMIWGEKDYAEHLH
jgi:hypothetical protein